MSTWPPTVAPSPPFSCDLFPEFEVNFRIYYCPCLAFPLPLHPYLIVLKGDPTAGNQVPEAKTSLNLPWLPLGFQERKFTEKLLSGLLFIQRQLDGAVGIFYATKLLLKQKAAELSVFHAALFILKEELNSCKE